MSPTQQMLVKIGTLRPAVQENAEWMFAGYNRNIIDGGKL
jgi:hypothetical protein